MAERSLFLGLPAELRNEIYTYLLSGWHHIATPGLKSLDKERIAYTASLAQPYYLQSVWPNAPFANYGQLLAVVTHSFKAFFRPNLEPEYSILRVNRQIYAEASAVLYRFASLAFLYEPPDVANPAPDLGLARDLEKSLPRLQKVLIDIREHHLNSFQQTRVRGIKERLR